MYTVDIYIIINMYMHRCAPPPKLWYAVRIRRPNVRERQACIRTFRPLRWASCRRPWNPPGWTQTCWWTTWRAWCAWGLGMWGSCTCRGSSTTARWYPCSRTVATWTAHSSGSTTPRPCQWSGSTATDRGGTAWAAPGQWSGCPRPWRCCQPVSAT